MFSFRINIRLIKEEPIPRIGYRYSLIRVAFYDSIVLGVNKWNDTWKYRLPSIGTSQISELEQYKDFSQYEWTSRPACLSFYEGGNSSYDIHIYTRLGDVSMKFPSVVWVMFLFDICLLFIRSFHLTSLSYADDYLLCLIFTCLCKLYTILTPDVNFRPMIAQCFYLILLHSFCLMFV